MPRVDELAVGEGEQLMGTSRSRHKPWGELKVPECTRLSSIKDASRSPCKMQGEMRILPNPSCRAPLLNSGYLKNQMGSASCNRSLPCPRARPLPLQFKTFQDPDIKHWVRSKSWPAQAPTNTGFSLRLERNRRQRKLSA